MYRDCKDVLDIRDYGFCKVQIEINNTCNFNCSFCSLPLSKLPKRYMKKEEVFRILDYLSSCKGIRYVTFPQFGEPLLNKNIWDYLDKCRSLGLKSELVTNGFLLNEENIDRLYKHRPDALQISLQIMDPKKHNKVRGTNSSYDLYINRIVTCLAKFIDDPLGNEDIHTDLAIQWDNFKGIIGLKRYFNSILGVREIDDPTISAPTVKSIKPYLINLLKMIQEKSNNFHLSIEQIDSNIREFYSKPTEIKRFVAYDFGNNNRIYFKPFFNGRKFTKYYPIDKETCSMPILGILADGKATLCNVDYDGFTSIGNIFEEDLASILYRNKQIITRLHKTGDIPFEMCKICLGSPTRIGVLYRKFRAFTNRL